MDQQTAAEIQERYSETNYLDALSLMKAGQVLRDLATLETFQAAMEAQIADFALDHHTDLLDDENRCIVRTYWFSQGIQEHFVILNPIGEILGNSKEIPTDLIWQVMLAVLSGPCVRS